MKTKKIQLKDVEVGMKIKSYDTNGVCFKEVVDKWDTIVKPEDQIKISFTNGTTLRCSTNHPIMVRNNDGLVIQKYPLDLTEFDEVITEFSSCYVDSVTYTPTNSFIDIEVADTNVFFASAEKHSDQILTHNSQGGVRGGAGNLNVQLWTLEAQDILVLKNNKGTEFTRVRQVDYTIQLNRVMYERLLREENISLFSTSEVPGLYEAFFRDTDEFRRLYEEAEADPNIRRITVPAKELFSSLMQERKDTGRIYIMNVDNANEQSPFIDDLIYMTNLCVEILEPTKPLAHVMDEEGRIALCTLSAINWGNIKTKEEFEKYCMLAVRGLNEILDYQEYPIPAAAEATKDYRSLGIGITNFAYWLAKNGYTYQNPTKESLAHFDEWCEAWSYYIIKASADLAKERGYACRKSSNTKYSQGLVPFDWRKKSVDELVEPVLRMPWDGLRVQMRETGIMNTPLMAQMPTETSSQPAGATNGFEPPRAIVTNKGSKDGILPQVVPEPIRLKNKYDPAWEQKSTKGYLTYAAILNKWMDQSGSWNTTYAPKHFENNKIPMSVLMEDLVYAYKYGLKTLYYQNTDDQAGEYNEDAPIESTEELDDLDDDCQSCKL